MEVCVDFVTGSRHFWVSRGKALRLTSASSFFVFETSPRDDSTPNRGIFNDISGIMPSGQVGSNYYMPWPRLFNPKLGLAGHRQTPSLAIPQIAVQVRIPVCTSFGIFDLGLIGSIKKLSTNESVLKFCTEKAAFCAFLSFAKRSLKSHCPKFGSSLAKHTAGSSSK